jgi:predicted SAM-dependent methyltransferase
VNVESSSAELVYCSHTVEHMFDKHIDHMLREAHRILKPGGVMRVTTPNAEQFYWAYRRRDAYFNFNYGHQFPFGTEGENTFSIPRMSIWIVNEIATQLVQGVGEERRGAKLLEKIDEIDRIFEENPTLEGALSKFCGMLDFDLQREVPAITSTGGRTTSCKTLIVAPDSSTLSRPSRVAAFLLRCATRSIST